MVTLGHTQARYPGHDPNFDMHYSNQKHCRIMTMPDIIYAAALCTNILKRRCGILAIRKEGKQTGMTLVIRDST